MTPKPNARDADVQQIGRLGNAYKLAIEHGCYRAAAWFAVAELRRGPTDVALWRVRLRGAFARRAR